MKNIFQFIKKYTLALSIIVIVFASTLTLAQAQYNPDSATISQTRQVQEFVRDASSLINRIGSLVIGSSQIPSFVGGESSNCINHENLIFHDPNDPLNNIASETCLSVVGESIFTFLRVENPAYFLVDSGSNSTAPVFNSYSSSLANYASYIVVGSFENGVLNMGIGDIFIVDDTSAPNESILVDGLKRLDALEDFAPRDTTTKTNLCADATGVLFTCENNAPSETYSWVEGDWGNCSLASAASCDGSWIETPIAGGKVDWQGNLYNWQSQRVFDDAGSNPPTSHDIDAVCPTLTMVVGYNINGDGNTSACITDIGDGYTLPGIYYWPEINDDAWSRLTVDSSGNVTVVQSNYAPLYQNGRIVRARCDLNNNGTWTDDLTSGLCNLGSGDPGEWENTGISCLPVTHAGAVPSIGIGANIMSTTVNGDTVRCYSAGSSTSTVQCSTSNPPNESTCIGQDSACSWTNAGTSVATRTVICQEDSSGTPVNDSFCDLIPKPATSSDDPSVAPNVCSVQETYSWNIGRDSICRNGIQQRTVTCLRDSDSSPVDDSFCTPPKPAEASFCPSEGAGGIPDGNWFVCGTDGDWKMGPSANSTIVAASSNYSTDSACGPGATAPVNNDAGAGGEDFYNADMRCWDAVPSDCSCFTTSGNIDQQRC